VNRAWRISACRTLTTAWVVALSSCANTAAAQGPPAWPAAQLRLKNANTIAAQRGDAAASAKIKDAAHRAKSFLASGNAAAAEQLVRDAEAAAGLDAGGASMSGVPVYHPTPAMAEQMTRLRNDLDAALRARDVAAVRRIVAQMRQALGDQAGLPTIAARGVHAEPRPVDPAAVVNLFLAALDENKPVFGQVAAGRPVGDNPVRFYAEIVTACCDVRPLVKRHRPDQLDHLDQLVLGACYVITALQQPAGHMPHPEPHPQPDAWGRGRWVVAPADDGGTQFDTGEGGAALLAAGVTYAKPEWTAAGLKAADWAAAQPCVRNFNYTACSIFLLAEAHRATRNRKYLDAALEKWELGLAPAQLESGRWVDAHNARTAYHVLLLRAVTALAAVCPDDTADRRDALRKSAAIGMKSLIDEFDRLGVTNTGYALPVLLRQQKLDPAADPRLAAAIDQTAAAILASCVRDGRPHLGVSPVSLASVARVTTD
jgi:hypothetical protein